MNILIPDSWLRDYLESTATPRQIKDCLSLSGPSVERINKVKNDSIYDIEITSNRPDTASILGIAREAYAILPRNGFKTDLKIGNILPFEKRINIDSASEKLPLKVTISDNSLCPRFTAIILDNINVGPSPEKISDRLQKSGIRPLNNVIDISNYLMRLFGQPVHIFDYEKIEKAEMTLRKSKKGEKITTLDGRTFTLPGEDIVIEDGQKRLIDLCGIMGAENSAVDKSTKKVLLFVQTYDPVRIRYTSTTLAHRTEASSLFEKHLHPALVLPTVDFGIKLLKEFAGGKIASQLVDIYPSPPKKVTISLTSDFINKRIGVKIKSSEIVTILRSLQFKVTEKENSFTVQPPDFRLFDVTLKEDIVEEVARIYGYHNLPSHLMTGEIPERSFNTDLNSIFSRENKLKTMLKYWGYTETYNYSFISAGLIKKAGLKISNHLKLKNPLTHDFEYMRRSLVPSMLATFAQNQSLKSKLRLFEIANIYLPQKDNLPQELENLVLAQDLDFYSLKGLIEGIFLQFNLPKLKQEKPTEPFFHPGKSVVYQINNQIIATVGALHPNLETSFQIKSPLYIAEVDIFQLFKNSRPVKIYKKIPSFPAVIEEITVNLTPSVKIGEVIDTIKGENPLIVKVEFLGKYKNAASFKIVYQDATKNLTTDETGQIKNKLKKDLKDKFQITVKDTPLKE